ncbi:MAG: hypothetical protein WD988_00535 [Candidatus Curtissbacteria bacterium]
MEANEGANLLLKKKYNLHASPAVKAAANRTLGRTGEKMPQDPLARIQNYLDRLDKIITTSPLEGNPRFDRKARNLDRLESSV